MFGSNCFGSSVPCIIIAVDSWQRRQRPNQISRAITDTKRLVHNINYKKKTLCNRTIQMLNLQALRQCILFYDNSGNIIAKDTCMGLLDTGYNSSNTLVLTSWFQNYRYERKVGEWIKCQIVCDQHTRAVVYNTIKSVLRFRALTTSLYSYRSSFVLWCIDVFAVRKHFSK